MIRQMRTKIQVTSCMGVPISSSADPVANRLRIHRVRGYRLRLRLSIERETTFPSDWTTSTSMTQRITAAIMMSVW